MKEKNKKKKKIYIYIYIYITQKGGPQAPDTAPCGASRISDLGRQTPRVPRALASLSATRRDGEASSRRGASSRRVSRRASRRRP